MRSLSMLVFCSIITLLIIVPSLPSIARAESENTYEWNDFENHMEDVTVYYSELPPSKLGGNSLD